MIRALLGLGVLLIAGNLLAYGAMQKPTPAPVTPPSTVEQKVEAPKPSPVVPKDKPKKQKKPVKRKPKV